MHNRAAMSEQNVELVRRIYEAWGREDSARDFIAADIEYVNPQYVVEPGTRRGRKSFAAVRDSYEDFELRIERIIDAGEEDVVVLAHYTGTGRGSGVPVAMPGTRRGIAAMGHYEGDDRAV